MGRGSDYVHGAVASVDTAEYVEYAAAACVVGGWDMGERERSEEGVRGHGGCISQRWTGHAVGFRACSVVLGVLEGLDGYGNTGEAGRF